MRFLHLFLPEWLNVDRLPDVGARVGDRLLVEGPLWMDNRAFNALGWCRVTGATSWALDPSSPRGEGATADEAFGPASFSAPPDGICSGPTGGIDTAEGLLSRPWDYPVVHRARVEAVADGGRVLLRYPGNGELYWNWDERTDVPDGCGMDVRVGDVVEYPRTTAFMTEPWSSYPYQLHIRDWLLVWNNE